MTFEDFRNSFGGASQHYRQAISHGEWTAAAAAADQASIAAEGMCDTLRDDGTSDLMAVGAFWLARAQLFATRAVSARIQAGPKD